MHPWTRIVACWCPGGITPLISIVPFLQGRGIVLLISSILNLLTWEILRPPARFCTLDPWHLLALPLCGCSRKSTNASIPNHRNCFNSWLFAGEERLIRAAILSVSCFISHPLWVRPHDFASCWKKLHLLGFNFKRFVSQIISTFSDNINNFCSSVSYQVGHLTISLAPCTLVQSLTSRPHFLCRPWELLLGCTHPYQLKN